MRKFEDPDSKVRKACFCGYTESDLKYKALTFWRVNFEMMRTTGENSSPGLLVLLMP